MPIHAAGPAAKRLHPVRSSTSSNGTEYDVLVRGSAGPRQLLHTQYPFSFDGLCCRVRDSYFSVPAYDVFVPSQVENHRVHNGSSNRVCACNMVNMDSRQNTTYRVHSILDSSYCLSTAAHVGWRLHTNAAQRSAL